MRASRLAGALAATAIVATTSALAQASKDVAPKLTRVTTFAHQVTGVTVSEDGRIFVNFPRWTEDSPVSVAELKDGKLLPYPDATWNAWRNANKDQLPAGNHWVCVQSVVADQRGSLWVIDPAAPAMATVVKDGPKLVQIDLKTDRVVRTIAFSPVVAPQGSYLNDVRLSPDGRTAYLTDSGAQGALIVVDIGSGMARRVLDGHPSTQPDKAVVVKYDGKPLMRPDGRGVEFAADGIALSNDGTTLYWQAIKGRTLYSIATAALVGPDAPQPAPTVVPTNVAPPAANALASQIRVVGENGPADGLLISRTDGRMYVSSPQDDSIKSRDLAQGSDALTLVFRDKRLRWPDTFAEGPDGTIYFTTSHIQDSAFYKPKAPAALPTELWSLKR